MIKLSNYTLAIFILINIFNITFGSEKFFNKGLEFYKDKKYDEAKFMFERNIVFNPKDSISYLYLAKVKDLSNKFTKVCKRLCNENKDILESLSNIEPKNES
jgi:tetratricopeptide (TPR) repeat protein